MTYLEKFENWKMAVEEMNHKSDELDSQRNSCYQWLADKIKEKFRDADIPIPRIHFSTNASKIVCTWESNSDFVIPYIVILDLHMDFAFDKVLDTEGNWKKRLVFYPFNG